MAAFFYFFSIKYNICKDFRETEIISIYKLDALKTGFRHPTQHNKNNKKYIFSYIKYALQSYLFLILYTIVLVSVLVCSIISSVCHLIKAQDSSSIEDSIQEGRQNIEF